MYTTTTTKTPKPKRTGIGKLAMLRNDGLMVSRGSEFSVDRNPNTLFPKLPPHRGYEEYIPRAVRSGHKQSSLRRVPQQWTNGAAVACVSNTAPNLNSNVYVVGSLSCMFVPNICRGHCKRFQRVFQVSKHSVCTLHAFSEPRRHSQTQLKL